MDICCIIDLDGFNTEEYGFLPRELGFVSMEDGDALSYRYDLSPFWPGFSSSSLRSVLYCESFVHGLRFNPWAREICRPHWEVTRDVIRLYKSCKTEGCNVVGYKGGCVERKLLDDFGIPSLNIEYLGCPKYDDLNATGKYNGLMCGNHVGNLHCSMSEVMAFRDFLTSQ